MLHLNSRNAGVLLSSRSRHQNRTRAQESDCCSFLCRNDLQLVSDLFAQWRLVSVQPLRYGREATKKSNLTLVSAYGSLCFPTYYLLILIL